jgi:two-component system LytT family response regulator
MPPALQPVPGVFDADVIFDGEVVERVSSEHFRLSCSSPPTSTREKAFSVRARLPVEAVYRAAFHAASIAPASSRKAGDHETHQRLIELLDERRRAHGRHEDREAEPGEGYLARFAVKHNQRMVLVKAADIDWIESSANYAHLHTSRANYVVRMTMGELERRLDPARFARIHRSTIVQVDRIQDIIAAWHGDYDVTLLDGTVLRLTRNYRDRVLDRKKLTGVEGQNDMRKKGRIVKRPDPARCYHPPVFGVPRRAGLYKGSAYGRA